MSVLYTPKGRAREYSSLAVNHYSGCSHGCSYCYVPTIPPFKFNSAPRHSFHSDPRPRRNLISQLESDCRRNPGDGQRVMLSFTTDPYQPIDVEHRLTRAVIQVLHAYGYHVQVLTKGGRRALYDLDLFTTGDAFATTMTYLSSVHSRKWEPRAALPADRILAIRAFHAAGIPTWVSLEPVLNPDSAIKIIRLLHPIVDLFKIGKLNHHPLADRFDWQSFGMQASALCEEVGVAYYIKHDLAAHFPANYQTGPHQVTVEQIERAPIRQPTLF